MSLRRIGHGNRRVPFVFYGPGGGPSGMAAVQTIQFNIGTGASQSSATTIPANAVVLRCSLNVTTPYSGGTTISIGQTGSVSLLMATSDNNPLVSNLYDALQDTSWGASPLQVLVTVGGAPGAGAGTVMVEWALPTS